MANPHRTEPRNRRVDELADLIRDASNDLMDWNYSSDPHRIELYIDTAHKLVAWAAELRDEVRRWSESGKAEVGYEGGVRR